MVNRIFMALGLALTGLTNKTNGKKLWTLDTVSWWDELELVKDRRFKKLDLGPGKLVYEAVMPVQDTLELNNKYKKDFLQVFDADPMAKSHYRKREKMVGDLESRLNDQKLRFVRVWIFDWDY